MGILKPERLGYSDFTDQPLSICGRALRAHMSGALYWPNERALIVSDLHLEKGSYFAAKGQMLPPYDTRETLRRLAEAIDAYNAETVIALGDSFHDGEAGSRMDAEDRETLRIMQDACDWIWIKGNHDRSLPDGIGGDVVQELRIEGLTLRHEPHPGAATHEIAGHLHPAARVVMYGTALRRPCFAGNGLRLIMPAFGAFTGGSIYWTTRLRRCLAATAWPFGCLARRASIPSPRACCARTDLASQAAAGLRKI